MSKVDPDKFDDYVKTCRNTEFATPFDLAYLAFVDLGYDKMDSAFFRQNASLVVETMRSQCWKEYVPLEREFSVHMLKALIDEEKVSHMSPVEAIEDFVMAYPEQIYKLSLSNTQSRRSRAGKEFEAILELLMIGADVSVDAQGSIGKSTFSKKDLGKLVDFISPGVTQYIINKRNTVLVSAKTTLRERWQEVPEEVTRTGIREMYLATLDDNITRESLNIMYEANVIVATTAVNKAEHYSYKGSNVVSFEELLITMTEAADKWNNYKYTSEDIEMMKKYLRNQASKHEKHPYVKKYYLNRLAALRAEQGGQIHLW